jgi:hypothetical protein
MDLTVRGLVLVVLNSMLVAAQAAGPAAENLVAPTMISVNRYAQKMEVPRKGKANVMVQAELSGWTSIKRAREITIPAQGFYIATLNNGTVITTINGEEKQRKAGEIWAVAEGQSMTLKIQDKRQETVGLEIFSLRASH